MFVFGLAIFTGAFLLFMVQPLIARFILPWFGGGPAVWTVCMLFFQLVLLGGYAYAHLIIRHLPPRRQVFLHLSLLGLALLLLPITPGEFWKPVDGTAPTWRIMLLLTACIGLPYLVLSATGPLMQAWFHRVNPETSPYRLYALSNVGSLLALLGYPFFVEPHLSRLTQANWWSLGLGVFAVMAVFCGMRVIKNAAQESAAPVAASEGLEAGENVDAESSAKGNPWFWFALPACGTTLLLAVTNTICGDIAVIPFLWVLPLSLYLLSFIISFDSPRWYWRPFWIPALVLMLLAVFWLTWGANVVFPATKLFRPLIWLHQLASGLSMFKAIIIYMLALFVCCMVCHGEVYRLRPPSSRLTGFYLMISAGGAFGGLFVAVIAPILFKGYYELHAGFFALAVLMFAVLLRDPQSLLYRGRPIWATALATLLLIGFGVGLFFDTRFVERDAVDMTRNFYGTLKVMEYDKNSDSHQILLMHGSTTHGVQYPSGARRTEPCSYYTKSSGIGRVMSGLNHQPNRRVGVVGLGIGTMTAFGRKGDYYRLYEINSEVIRLAKNRFFYLHDARTQYEIIDGDARLSLEREPSQQFDLLVLDAFSSDAIPVHLLTREAFEIYRRHMKTNGVIAVHISNKYLDLEPVVMKTAQHFGFHTAILHDNGDQSEYEEDWTDDGYYTDWVMLGMNKEFLDWPSVVQGLGSPGKYPEGIKMWTDDKSDLFRVIMVDSDGWLGSLRKWVLGFAQVGQ
jgi:spermidine synthase